MSRLKINETNISGTTNDNNNRFDIDKLMALDRNELNKLNDLYGEYRRFHGPKFTPEIWNKCLEAIVTRFKYFDKKYAKKPFGWINTIIYHQFIKEIKYPESEIIKHKEVDKFEDLFQSNDNEPIIFIGLIEDDVIDEAFPDERKLSRSELLENLVSTHCTKEEQIIFKLYIKGAYLQKEERLIINNIKHKLRNVIYTQEQIIELKKKRAFHQTDGRSKRGRENSHKWKEERKNLSEEERNAVRLQRRNEKREKMLNELKETNPKKYRDKLKQIERYERIAKEKPTYNVDKQATYRKKRKEDKQELRKDLLKNNEIL